MPYDVPGTADALDSGLVDMWNETIAAEYQRLDERDTRFFALDPEELTGAAVTRDVGWPGDPQQPTFCTDDQTIRTLSD